MTPGDVDDQAVDAGVQHLDLNLLGDEVTLPASMRPQIAGHFLAPLHGASSSG
ncbi:hypothetical protein [Mycobacterium sp.]|uniref:hypothetical protein n=1 Tax=Mycobacterium sp. TaxID=1785 RepID=UPI003D141E3D